MDTKNIKYKLVIIFIFIFIFISLQGCISLPKETVELSEITGKQITELQSSHIKFVQLYYSKLKDDVNNFIDTKWAPLFLSKAVENKAFRSDLDNAYITSNIEPEDLTIKWKNNSLQEPQKSAVLAGVEQAITDERAKLGGVLIDWSEEAQRQITKMRMKLLKPVTDQEKLVLEEINAAYYDLQRSQAAIKAYLSSAVELKEKNELVLKKLGALDKVKKVMNKAVSASDTLTKILGAKDDAENAVSKFLDEMGKTQEEIEAALSDI